MRTILIEGWRGVNHSFALVNQNQILQLTARPDIALFHRDMPFFSQTWSRHANEDGFSASDRRLIDAPGDPGDAAVDAVYRICSPFRLAPPGRAVARAPRAIAFVVTELGLAPPNFASEADRAALLGDGDEHLVVTPSEWSWERIVEFGVAPDRVRVVPHGVDTARFRRIASPDERRALRSRFGLSEDETVFLHVGAAFWAKGIDLLLRAVGVLLARGRKVRLLVKDQRALYGITAEQALRSLAAHHPDLDGEKVAAALVPIPGNLSPELLSALYGAADAYVSPYRAEGFNLPVLEAISCGVPSVVTKGGATDDFCTDALAVRLAGRLRRGLAPDGTPTTHVEPDFDHLVDAMDAFATGWRPDTARFETARTAVLERLTWDRATSLLLAALFGPEASARHAA